MKTLKYLMVLGLSVIVMDASAGQSSAEILLNNYYSDQASKQIGQILPKGKFGVQISLKVNSSKMKAALDVQPVKLPFGGTFVSGSELKASGMVDQSMEELLKYVEKINIIVSIAPEISTQAQELISKVLESMILLEPRRGDKITFVDLPESVVSAWAPEQNIEIYKKPTILVSIFFGIILLFASGLIALGIRRVSAQISKEAHLLTGAMKEVLGNTGTMTSGAIQAERVNPAFSPVLSESVESANPQFWEKVDQAAVTVFCFDCIAHPIYSEVPKIMAESLLDPVRGAELEKSLPAGYLRNFNGETKLNAPAVIQLFQKNQSEYRRATKSAIAQEALKLTVPALVGLSSELPSLETALLISSLTPLKRVAFLKSLSADSKLIIAEASVSDLSAVQYKNHEVSLVEKIRKLAPLSENDVSIYSLGYLTSIILRSESFQEDEAFYEKQGVHDYQGVLLALDIFQQSDWEAFSPQDLAIAFSGYSEKYRNTVIEKHSGKKLEWVKNFFTKFTSVKPDFRSAQVESIHGLIKSKIKTIRASGADSENKQAA